MKSLATLVPPLVTTLTLAPALRPNEASYWPVCTLNSWMLSGLGVAVPPVKCPDPAVSLISTPFI